MGPGTRNNDLCVVRTGRSRGGPLRNGDFLGSPHLAEVADEPIRVNGAGFRRGRRAIWGRHRNFGSAFRAKTFWMPDSHFDGGGGDSKHECLEGHIGAALATKSAARAEYLRTTRSRLRQKRRDTFVNLIV